MAWTSLNKDHLQITRVPEDYEGVPLLFVRAAWNSGRYVQFLANTLKGNVIESDTCSYGSLARYRDKRDDDVDNDRVKRMQEVDEAIEIGAFVEYQTGNCHMSLQVANDFNDAHEGLLVTLEGGYTLPIKAKGRQQVPALGKYFPKPLELPQDLQQTGRVCFP